MLERYRYVAKVERMEPWIDFIPGPLPFWNVTIEEDTFLGLMPRYVRSRSADFCSVLPATMVCFLEPDDYS